MDNEAYLKQILQNTDDRGHLKNRESSSIEFKENFNLSNMSKYAKTMAAFANNKGGYLLFGIKDSPRKLIGVNKDRFDNIKQERISSFLIEHFDPEIKWDIGMVYNGENYSGYIYIYESEDKPVICKKNAGNDDIRSGEIYFRYRGQSRKIGYSELKKIIDDFREKERRIWMSHIEKIARIGPSNVAILDMLRGDLHVKNIEGAKLIIDKNLINDLRNKVQFIEEGKFSEAEGEPTLKIVGEIQTADVVVPRLDPNKDYPYLQKHLSEQLRLRPYDVQLLIWKYHIKGNRKYHIEVETSKSGKVHKYSKYVLKYLKEILDEQRDKHSFLNQISKEYQAKRRKNR